MFDLHQLILLSVFSMHFGYGVKTTLEHEPFSLDETSGVIVLRFLVFGLLTFFTFNIPIQ